MKAAETLAEIEALDLRHQALTGEQEAAAVRAKTDPTVRQLRQGRAQMEAQAQEQDLALRQLELETAELGGRVKSHEKAIYDGSVRHPADLQRRQHELQALRTKIAGLEETELAQMESQEQTASELAELRTRLDDREREVERLRRADRDRALGLAAELAAVEAERLRLVESAPGAAVRFYERTVARRQPAVARVVGGTCSGCRLPLAPRLLQEARGEQLVTCENCERILLL
jgi:predicted  nucleic acid-binding Zn-ribbon protein